MAKVVAATCLPFEEWGLSRQHDTQALACRRGPQHVAHYIYSSAAYNWRSNSVGCCAHGRRRKINIHAISQLGICGNKTATSASRPLPGVGMGAAQQMRAYFNQWQAGSLHFTAQ